MSKGKSRQRWPAILLWFFVGIPAMLLVLLAIINFIVMPLITQHRQEVTMPNLLGMEKDSALALLERLGFSLGDIRTVTDSAAPAGRVAGQYPAPGRRVKPGRPINLDISRGPEFVSVPDVVGSTLESALAQLTDKGLLVSDVESLRTPNFPQGQVIAIRPPAGTEVKIGTPVVLAVSAAVGSFPMPSLLGMNLETARGIIASQGLILAEVKYVPIDEPSGIVIVQYPEEGMPVRDKDSCVLIVSSPPSDAAENPHRQH